MHKPKRQRRTINYARLNEGIVEIEQTHPHVAFFRSHSPSKNPRRESITDAIDEFYTKTGVEPLYIPKESFDLLEMHVDSTKFTPKAIAEILGEEVPVHVMDSVTQQPVRGFNLKKWRDYFDLDHSERSQITAHGTLNLITLEFSDTELSKHVSRPKKIETVDLVEEIWAKPSAPTKTPKPKVQLYSLTGAEGSFTDFHIDFAGSSVYYHVLSGAKSFIFVPPTKQNLRAYERWCTDSDQSSVWFPSLVKDNASVMQLDLGEGDSMLIPAGWIHAVYTPKDTCVVGGNFITEKDMTMQVEISEIEARCKVPKKFRFPSFDVVQKYVKQKQEHAKQTVIKQETITQETVKTEPENESIKVTVDAKH